MSLRERALRVLPGGGFGNFDPGIFIARGDGSRVWDDKGKEYIDYLIGSGPMILGHGNAEVIDAVRRQLERGMTFFANNPEAVELAEEICASVACAEQLRYVSTGGEADMYAMRLARAHTGRDKILKFEGGYHGMSSEALMSLAPTRLEDFPRAVPDSSGIPDDVRDNMVIAPYNDIDTTRRFIEACSADIACIIVEPLQRIIPPEPGFLQFLRDAASEHRIVLVFDEVVTGYRLAYGGAQEHYGVTPDLCTLGKIIGGGLPLAAIAGRADIMAHFDRSKTGRGGFAYQVGTLSGNPLASVAGLKTLEILRRPGSYERLRNNGRAVMRSLERHLTKAGVPYRLVGDPVLFDVVFTPDPVRNYRDVLKNDAGLWKRFNTSLREQGILKPPLKFYASLALTEEDLARTDAAIEIAAGRLPAGG